MSIAAAKPGEAAVVGLSDTRAPVASCRRRRLGKTLATMLWVCLILLLAEAGFRVRAHLRYGGEGGPIVSIYEPDELLGRRPRPSAELLGTRHSLSINRWGFRGKDIPQVKPPGTVRIVALGDSTAFGMGASSDGACWIECLARTLNEQSPSQAFDAINAGVPGYTLATSTLQLTERILPFEPDIVVDFQIAPDLAAHGRRQFPPVGKKSVGGRSLTKFTQKHSQLLNLIRKNTVAFHAKHVARTRHDRLDERGIVEYADRLRQMVAACRAHGLELILCTCPRAFGDPGAPTDQHKLAATALVHTSTLSLEGFNDAYTRYNEAIRQVARENNVPLVDLDRLVPKREAYFDDSIHLNDEGHRLVAGLLAKVIKSRVPHPSPDVGTAGARILSRTLREGFPRE